MNCDIDVWLIELPLPAALADLDLALLSPAEHARVRGYSVPRPACEFALTRTALRRILGARVGLAPAQVTLATAANGKPFMPEAPRCFFNVSHAGGLAAIAVHDSADVGIDVEHRSSFMDPAALLDEVCAPLERAWLRDRADAASLVDRLATLWTGKEAVLKAVGTGLATPLVDVDLSASAARGSGRVVLPAEVAPEPGLQLLWQALAVPAGWHGALAARASIGCASLRPRYRTLAAPT
jgi:4'-phosphopantetheinyl transferase